MQDYDPDDFAPWIDCWQCGGEGEIEGDCDCMEDSCCCLVPTPPRCDVCRGAGGWPDPDWD
jgi:hypothetical protein